MKNRTYVEGTGKTVINILEQRFAVSGNYKKQERPVI